jgi:hypothetical protein
MKRLFFILLIFILGRMASGQEGYNIKFRIAGLKDTTCLVANYYGNGTYVKDTLKVDASGKCTFSAPDTLPRGVYILVITDKSTLSSSLTTTGSSPSPPSCRTPWGNFP